MATIPTTINGVAIEFSGGVTNDVTDEMLAAMESTIASTVDGKDIEKLWVSSAKDSHRCPSRHVTGNGIDVSRINGKKVIEHYDSDTTVKAIVDGLQTRFENAPKRRENFGPTIKKKNGVNHNVSGHLDHFHWSVNGDHSACTFSLLDRIKSWWNATTKTEEAKEGVCDI